MPNPLSLSQPDALSLRLYRRALTLYPAPFRTAHAEQALLTARDWHADACSSGTTLRFNIALARDLAVSLAQEHATHTAQLRSNIMQRPFVLHTVSLIVLTTVIGTIAAITGQQLLRRGADQPQQQMIQSYTMRLGSGAPPDQVIPAGQIDIAQSLEPFLVLYDDAGHPLRSNALLDAAIPTPPAGIFAHTREHGSDTLTWQPRPGVRLATVVTRVPGPRPGFLLAGRSLRQVEEYESLWRRLTIASWLIIVALIGGSATLLNRSTRTPLPA